MQGKLFTGLWTESCKHTQCAIYHSARACIGPCFYANENLRSPTVLFKLTGATCGLRVYIRMASTCCLQEQNMWLVLLG